MSQEITMSPDKMFRPLLINLPSNNNIGKSNINIFLALSKLFKRFCNNWPLIQTNQPFCRIGYIHWYQVIQLVI